MLVTFTCKGHENITLFGNIAVQLLNFMGHSGIVPSAILAEDVPEALAQLQKRIETIKQGSSNESSNDDDGEPVISVAHRAIPLISLLQDAVKNHSNVMWDKN